MSSIRRNRWTALVGLTLACASTASLALTVQYTATQGPKQNLLSPLPPVLTADVSAQVNGFYRAITVLGANEFEGTPTSGFAYNGGTATLSAGAATIIDGDAQNDDEHSQGRYNMTPGVVNPVTNDPLFGHWLEATNSFTYSFSTAISAFGFYGTDFGDFEGSITMDFLNSNSLVYSAELTTVGANGNLLFFGLASTDLFNTVNFRLTQGSTAGPTDVLGFDSFIVGTANAGPPPTPTPAPEPGSLALVGLALAGLGATAGKARRARQG